MSRHHFHIPLLTSSDGMSQAQEKMADDLIDQVALMNHSDEMAGDDDEGKANRNKFWLVVFSGWDTSMMPTMPQPIAQRTNTWSYGVGTLRRDCPPAGSPTRTGTGRRQTVQALGAIGPARNPGARNRQSRQAIQPYALPQAVNPAIPDQRRAGRAVYIKPTFNRDITLAQFMYVDSRGQFVGTQDIRWTDDKTEEQVRAEAMEAWDRLESARIGHYNRALAAFWARQRLLRTLLRRARLDDQVLDMFHEENFDLMQEIYTAKDALMKTYMSIQASYELMSDAPIFRLNSLHSA